MDRRVAELVNSVMLRTLLFAGAVIGAYFVFSLLDGPAHAETRRPALPVGVPVGPTAALPVDRVVHTAVPAPPSIPVAARKAPALTGPVQRTIAHAAQPARHTIEPVRQTLTPVAALPAVVVSRPDRIVSALIEPLGIPEVVAPVVSIVEPAGSALPTSTGPSAPVSAPAAGPAPDAGVSPHPTAILGTAGPLAGRAVHDPAAAARGVAGGDQSNGPLRPEPSPPSPPVERATQAAGGTALAAAVLSAAWTPQVLARYRPPAAPAVPAGRSIHSAGPPS